MTPSDSLLPPVALVFACSLDTVFLKQVTRKSEKSEIKNCVVASTQNGESVKDTSFKTVAS